MQASDIMTTNLVTVGLSTPVREIAELLLTRRVSAVPVIDSDGHVLGIVSEGDLMRRTEAGTEEHPSWWLRAFSDQRDLLKSFIKSHGKTAEQVMTRNLVTISGDTPVNEIAGLLEKHRIKRVPVVHDGRIVGIVSRANLLHGLASLAPEPNSADIGDREIREAITKVLSKLFGLGPAMINVVVKDGDVELWGTVNNEIEERAAIVAAEGVPGVGKIESHLGRIPAWNYGI